ncbi:hypothetical protein [Pseudoteredinibacter isoporae]|uniref:Uncharacterized protein n=1 Tax=Pseudoteredinibacter isoporae TaxID=570281 RepID=A0A7X0JU81_9GAMM|nr:hypothetical protein [Pseudoteredinibacter isoporae]MBB6522380.1 hypothetical protein [Pseudoteredinibacter isoporae]NHO87913.1 hypothetical protein [Pseudoteredinibacter isoporae]NIB23756.1 hypothetical protein [Pseudoteredinibacter isoporae]
MKLTTARKFPRKAGPALLAIALSFSLAACKTQSTSSQSPSGIPASKPPSSSSPSSPSPSGSSGSQSSSQSSNKGSTQSSSSQSSSNSPGGSQGERSSEANPGGSPGAPQPGASQAGGPNDNGDSAGEPGAEGESVEVLDSPYYDQYDPTSDTGADVSQEGTSPSARSQQDDVSFDESQGGGGTAGQSNAERQASLEAELEGSFGRYDGMILRERDKVLAEGASRGAEDQLEQEAPGFDGEGGSEGGGGNPYGDPKTQAGGRQQGEEGDGQAPNESPEQGGAPGAPSGNNLPTVPDDIPDGSDDDIVARQIREAAMAEKDPKLREKLWEEYRKYKQR